ncbi:hypothetical protein [Streptomyces sp. NPDC001927]
MSTDSRDWELFRSCFTEEVEDFERTPHGWRTARLKLTALWVTGNFGVFQTALRPQNAATPA